MADQRMIHRSVVCSDEYIDLSFEAQALYIQLTIEADNFGFVGGVKKIMRSIGVTENTITELTKARFVIPFDSGVFVIRHWMLGNGTFKNDRTYESKYPKELSQVVLDVDLTYGFQVDSNGFQVDSPSTSTSTSTSSRASIISNTINKALHKQGMIKSSSSSSSEPRARAHEEPDDNDDHPPDSLESFLQGIVFLDGMTNKVLGYRSKLSDDLIRYGVERAQECGGKSFKYVRVILDSFVGKGYTTVAQAQTDELKREIAKTSKTTGAAAPDPNRVLKTLEDGTKLLADGTRILPNGEHRDQCGGIIV